MEGRGLHGRHDNAAGIILLDQVAEHTGGTVREALVDQGFKNQVVLHCAGLGFDLLRLQILLAD